MNRHSILCIEYLDKVDRYESKKKIYKRKKPCVQIVEYTFDKNLLKCQIKYTSIYLFVVFFCISNEYVQ